MNNKLKESFKVIENAEIYFRDETIKLKDVFQSEILYLKDRVSFIQIVRRKKFPKDITTLKKMISSNKKELVDKVTKDLKSEEHETTIGILRTLFIQTTKKGYSLNSAYKCECELIYQEIVLYLKYYYYYQCQPDLFNKKAKIID